MRRAWPVVLAVTAVLAGCGGDDGGGGGDEASSLFAARCGSCHTLEAAGTSGKIGPNFDEVRLHKQFVLDTIKDPPPGPMPANLLSGADAQRVAEFLQRESGKEAVTPK